MVKGRLRAAFLNLTLMMSVHVTLPAAEALKLVKDRHPEILLHISGGCCDGTSAMCMTQDEFLINDTDVLIGHALSVPVYMPKDLFSYWDGYELTLDATSRDVSGFSLEVSVGVRLVVKGKREVVCEQ